MQSYSRQALQCALGATGLERGCLVFVQTALYAPGRIEDTPLAEISSRLYSALRKLIGPQGTVVVPTFHQGFARGESFDRQYTPATGMGSFSEYVRLLPRSQRSAHALHSVAAEGPLAEAITGRNTPSAFGRASPFDALIDYDAQILMFGCTVEACCLVRWAEEAVGVPYRRWMICRGPYVDDGQESLRSFHTYAGQDGREPNLCLRPVHRTLHDEGSLKRIELGSGVVESCTARDFAVATTEILRRDPVALLASSSADGQRSSRQP